MTRVPFKQIKLIRFFFFVKVNRKLFFSRYQTIIVFTTTNKSLSIIKMKYSCAHYVNSLFYLLLQMTEKLTQLTQYLSTICYQFVHRWWCCSSCCYLLKMQQYHKLWRLHDSLNKKNIIIM